MSTAIFPNARFPELFAEVYRVLRRNTHFYLFCDPETMFVAKPLAELAGFRFWKPLIWDKRKIGMGYHYRARYECILFFEKGKRKLADRRPNAQARPRRGRGGGSPSGVLVDELGRGAIAGVLVDDQREELDRNSTAAAITELEVEVLALELSDRRSAIAACGRARRRPARGPRVRRSPLRPSRSPATRARISSSAIAITLFGSPAATRPITARSRGFNARRLSRRGFSIAAPSGDPHGEMRHVVAAAMRGRAWN